MNDELKNENFVPDNNDFISDNNDSFISDKNIDNDTTNPKQRKYFQEVPIYNDLLDPNRKNTKIYGFDFDVDTFENLIDCFTPKENIPVILGVQRSKLDVFCNRAYGMNYDEVYVRLSGITDSWSRKVIKNLSASGNSTALNIMSKHFMGLSDDNKNQGVNITIVNDLKEDGED